MKLNENGRDPTVDAEPEMPLLWVLRDELGIMGPKYGCGIAQCGACTVHIDGVTVRSCSLRDGDVQGSVATIERLGRPDALHAVQKAWIEHHVAQCGTASLGKSWRLQRFSRCSLRPLTSRLTPRRQPTCSAAARTRATGWR